MLVLPADLCVVGGRLLRELVAPQTWNDPLKQNWSFVLEGLRSVRGERARGASAAPEAHVDVDDTQTRNRRIGCKHSIIINNKPVTLLALVLS